jgi:hypothetical protein
VAQYAGFSLHGGIGVEADQREKLERLTRYVSRPPVSVERLSLTAQGHVRYRLKTRYRAALLELPSVSSTRPSIGRLARRARVAAFLDRASDPSVIQVPAPSRIIRQNVGAVRIASTVAACGGGE